MDQQEIRRQQTRQMLVSLLSGSDEDVKDLVVRNKQLFDINLFQEIKLYAAGNQSNSSVIQNVQRVLNGVLETITKNTVNLFLHHPDRAVRQQIAAAGWELLNNRYAGWYWHELIQSASPEEQEQLSKFIELAKSHLLRNFLSNDDMASVLGNLKNYRHHLLSLVAVDHALPFANDSTFANELMIWGYEFLRQNVKNPVEYLVAADKCLKSALELLIADEKDNRMSLANIYEYLGTVQSQMRSENPDEQADAAIAWYEKAILFFTKEEFPDRYGHLLMLLGTAYSSKMKPDRSLNVEKAIQYFDESEALQDGKDGTLAINSGNGHLVRFIGDQQVSVLRAIASYQRAITLLGNDTFNLGMAYNNLGVAYKLLKPVTQVNVRKAYDSFMSAIEFRTRLQYPYEWAETLHNLGSLYALLPQNNFYSFTDALSTFDQALTVRTSTEYPYDWAGTCHDIAEVYMMEYLSKGSLALLSEATRNYDNALSVRTPEVLPYDAITSSSKVGMLLHNEGRYEEAISYLSVSLKAFNTLIESADSFTTKRKVIEAYDYIFQFLISCYLMTNQLNPALELCVRIKGSLFAERMSTVKEKNEAKFSRRYKLSSEWEAIEQHSGAIQTLRENIVELLKQGNSDAGAKRKMQELRQKLFAAYERRKLEVEKFDTLYPVQAVNNLFRSISPANARQLSSDLSAVIVEYYRGLGQWYAFVVSGEYLKCFALPSQADAMISETERWIRSFTALQPQHLSLVTEEKILGGLYDTFFQPFEHLLSPGKKLILSPQGKLHHLPLNASLNRNTGKILFEDFAVCMAAGLNSINALYQQHRQSHQKISGSANALILVHQGDATEPLEHVHEEADAIKKMFDKYTLLDESNATFENLKKEVWLNSFSVCHFCCHGSISYGYPQLSGLRLTDFITIEQISRDIQLTGAPLICLSACQTSYSHISAGDELTGISQSFLEAGASAVIGSLWVVDDTSTNLLFQSFYQGLVTDGMDVYSSMRRSIQQLRAGKQYRSLYYWGAFQIAGVALS